MQLSNAGKDVLPRHVVQSTISNFLWVEGTGSCQDWCILDRNILEVGGELSALSRIICCAMWDTHKLPSVSCRSCRGREAETEDLGVCNGPLASTRESWGQSSGNPGSHPAASGVFFITAETRQRETKPDISHKEFCLCSQVRRTPLCFASETLAGLSGSQQS